MKQFIYRFDKNHHDCTATYSNHILGNKGCGLMKMCSIGINIPPGFIISTQTLFENFANKPFFDVCASENILTKNIMSEIISGIKFIEQKSGKIFGSSTNPLLLSVRSGAKVSMPGMMDTILNCGMNEKITQGLATITNNDRFAYDCYRRFIEKYASIVLEIDYDEFEDILSYHKSANNIAHDGQLSYNTLLSIISDYYAVLKRYDRILPQDPFEQLWAAINMVFKSWNSNRAVKYRMMNNIQNDLYTAVIVQTMVFGNLNSNSATGVVFTRNPTTGDKQIFGEFLQNAQGEDVVSGAKHIYPIHSIHSTNSLYITDKQHYQDNHTNHNKSMECTMNDLYQQLIQVCAQLENYFLDMQDIEFTIEDGVLWILQSRSAKRTIEAALAVGCDMFDDGIISEERAILMIEPSTINNLLHPILDPEFTQKEIIASGLPASPGAVSGKIVLTSDAAEVMSKEHNVILVRSETSPEDIAGMYAASGILTSKGGMTSHAAVIARSIGKPCVSGAHCISINSQTKQVFILGSKEHMMHFSTHKLYGNIVSHPATAQSCKSHSITLNEGDTITIDGSTGNIILGEIPTITPTLPKTFQRIINWAKSRTNINVRVNAENENDINTGISFGACGIGLCRTEHMFFGVKRILAFRRMILSESSQEIQNALNVLIKYQIEDFKTIFKITLGLPVTIRLLDPPLHEFLPRHDDEILHLAQELNMNHDNIRHRINVLMEHNPMLGHRGCRLAITTPEIYEMQVKAIFTAALEIQELYDAEIVPEIMVPFVMNVEEVRFCKQLVKRCYDNMRLHIPAMSKLKYKFGSMIELPKAAMLADKIATEVDFFSFGTNDLTQMCLGLSRDDSAPFCESYIQKNILKSDPFTSLDSEVARLIKVATKKSKKANPDMKINICGEHGGDLNAIKFFNKIGINTISCQPYKVISTIIATSQACLNNNKKQLEYENLYEKIVVLESHIVKTLFQDIAKLSKHQYVNKIIDNNLRKQV